MSQPKTNGRDEYDPSWITGKALERHFSMQDALIEFSRLFRDEENDRALAIVGGAFLDTLLEHMLIKFLVDDEKEVGELMRYDGPMGTYSGRIRAAYCLGLLRYTVRDDLRLVGKIRNRFAHDLENPVFKWMRKSGRFAELLHELPLYVYRKSLKQDQPEVYQQARKLYQTRNSLAHRGESAKDRDLYPIDLFGAVDAMKCVREVFGWFGVPGKWSIPFENSVDEWRSRSGNV